MVPEARADSVEDGLVRSLSQLVSMAQNIVPGQMAVACCSIGFDEHTVLPEERVLL